MGSANQGGSVISFVIVGVVLAALLVGGVYFVNQQTSQSAQVPVEEQPQKPLPEQQSDEQKPEDDQSDEAQTPPVESQKDSATDDRAVELPATGPKETVGVLLATGALSATIVGYARSRRPRLSL